MGRYGRGKAATLRRAVHDRLVMHEANGELPTNNRFVLYELRQDDAEALYGHPRRGNGRSDDQNLSDASTWLRDKGIVPWSWIADETRAVTAYMYADTVADYLRRALEDARINPWGDGSPPMIVCESRTFGGVLSRTVAAEYMCPVAPTNGQVGGFLRTNVAPYLVGNNRPVLYVSDFDLAGHHIEENTRRVLVREAGEREWVRVALTADQVEAYHLPVVVKTDRRYRPPRAHAAVEVEALGQGVVTDLIRAALDKLLPEPLGLVREREAEQRERARAKL